MKTTQKEKVKHMLEQGWVCSSQFLEVYISEYRTRINDLRKDGLIVDTRPCENPDHRHDNKGMQEWRLKTTSFNYPELRKLAKEIRQHTEKERTFSSVVKNMEQELNDKVARLEKHMIDKFCCLDNYKGFAHNAKCFKLKELAKQPVIDYSKEGLQGLF